MAWNDDIKRIMAIVPQIEALKRDLNNPEKPLYNELEMKGEIKKLKSSVSKLSDGLLAIKRSESSARTSQELAENFERELLIVKSKLDELKQVKPQKYDDKWIKDEIKSVKSSIPNAHDDTEVKSAISQLLKYCESQNETINSLSKECGKINELLNAVKERDATIKDLKLGLKRAESSAKTCEELMINMERKVNELSARLNNGN